MPRGRKKGTRLVAARKKNPVLVDKRGGIRQKAVNNYRDYLMNSNILTPLEKQTEIQELDDAVKKAHEKKTRLTLSSYQTKAVRDRREKMVRNAGYDYEDFLDFYKIDEADWIDSKNWNKETFKDPNSGKEYEFEFRYEGSILRVI